MSKRKSPTNSEIIRQILEKEPDASAATVIDRAAEQGRKVAPGLVYNVKGSLGKHKKKKSGAVLVKKAIRAADEFVRDRTRRTTPSRTSRPVTLARDPGNVVATVKRVQQLANEVGGLDKLQELAEAMEAVS